VLIILSRKEVIYMLKEKLPDISKVIRGTLLKRYFKCKDKSCECQRGKKIHGPNYYITFSTDKYSKHVYVPKDQVEKVKEYIRNYNKIWEYLKKASITNIKEMKRRNLK